MATASQWVYSTTRDELRSADTSIARLVGSSTINAGASKDAAELSLLLRHGAQGEDAYFMLTSGRLACLPRKCELVARLDDGQVMTWDAAPGQNENVIFVNSPKVFTEALRLGKRLIVEVAIEGMGNRQFTFDVQNLNWPSVQSPKSAPASIGGIAWGGKRPADAPPLENSEKSNTKCYVAPAPTEPPWNAVPIAEARYCFVNERFVAATLTSKQDVGAGKKLLSIAKQFFGQPDMDAKSYSRWTGIEDDKTVRAAIYLGTKAKESSFLMLFYEPLEPYVVRKDPQ